MTTLLDHRTTLAYLAYLGYPDEPRTAALHVTRPRKADRRKGKSTRNVFLCYVCGAAGSGKTSLLRAFAGKPFSPVYEPTKKMNSVVNSVDLVDAQVRSLQSGVLRRRANMRRRSLAFESSSAPRTSSPKIKMMRLVKSRNRCARAGSDTRS